MNVALEIGCDEQGGLTALKAEISADIGAYVFTSGIATAEVAAAHIAGAYRFPNIAVAVRCIGTNKTPMGTYRGAGQPEAAFALECLLEVLAKEIRMSAADLRARNLVRPQEMPYRVGTSLFGHGLVYENSDFPGTFATALRESGYTDEVEIAANGERVAYGIGCGVETGGLVNFKSARVRADPDGSVAVTSGMSSQGQGQFTTYAQVCAKALGVPFQSVAVRLGDTDLIPFGRGAFAARGAVMGANAVLGATQRLRTKVIEYAATLLQCPASALDIHNGEITRCDGGSTDLSIAKIARAVGPGGPLFAGEAVLEASFVYEAKHPLTSGFSVQVAKIRTRSPHRILSHRGLSGHSRRRTSAQSHDCRRAGRRRRRGWHWRRGLVGNDLRRERAATDRVACRLPPRNRAGDSCDQGRARRFPFEHRIRSAFAR